MPAVLLFLKSVPLVRWAEIAVVLALITLYGYLGLTIQHLHVDVANAKAAMAVAQKATSDEKAARAAENAVAQANAASAAANALRTTAQITTDQQEIEDAHNLIAKQSQAVRAAADAVNGGLLNAFRAAAPAAPGGSAAGRGAVAVAGGASGAAPGDLRADVFAEWQGRTRTLEDALDDEYQRHDACVAEYRSVQSRINGQRAGVTP